jgi:biotin carboxyl carrier protein
VVESFRCVPPGDFQGLVRIDASGLLERRTPWIVPSYDANFALIIVSGSTRHDTLDGLVTVLETALQVQGNAELHTNLYPLLGILTLMQALPPETAFRTDTSLLWMALVSVITAQKLSVLSLLPTFPRQATPYESARFARLIGQVIEAGLARPSRLLTFYLKRLIQSEARPLAPLEVIWQWAEELGVPQREEERQQGLMLRQAIDALWVALEGSNERFTAFCRLSEEQIAQSDEAKAICHRLIASDPQLTPDTAMDLLQHLVGWIRTPVPAVQVLVDALERTQLHTLLIPNDDLSLERPAYLGNADTVARLHHLLSGALRPTMLRQGELLSPMEATIYHQPEPGTPSFVEIGAEVSVGQTLALLEAMKMFTELPSPVQGVVVDILVENGQGVKTGEPLFKIVTQEENAETAADAMPQLMDLEVRNRFRLL